MDVHHIPPAAIARKTRSPLSEPALLSDALMLAGAFAFEMGEDGHLDPANRDALAHNLVEMPDMFSTAASDWEARLGPDDVRARRAALSRLTFVGARYKLDYVVRDGMGEHRHFREIAEAMACADGRATLIRGVLLDRTGEASRNAAIAWRARHDPLTRLPNRSCLDAAAVQLSALSIRTGVPAYLLRVRIGNWRRYVDTYGEEIGDQLLGEVGHRLRAASLAPDMAFRLGGADFAIGSLTGDLEDLATSLEILLGGQPVHTAMGALPLDIDIASVRLGALRDALDATRAVLEDDLDYGSRTPQSQPIDIDQLLRDDRITLAFQPIVHAKTGALHHYECLLRLRLPDGRIESAYKVILAAEQSGQVTQLDRRALDLALPFLKDDGDVRLALNVSAGTIADEAASAAYIASLTALGSDAARITIEMTETLALDDPALASSFAAAVRALGCAFAVDDFGSGHTSFRNLLAVEADSIKIDGSLVAGVATDENKQAFIRMMVDLAATFSVQTVAEMVEDHADAIVLARIGVDYLQGYYYGRPVPAPSWPRLSPDAKKTVET
ncbi:EAL domain-containing protein [Algimonas porphyrae]|uniref:GGDEF-domain containing protein n=1 Tax=Algimonas porphyrae TaxID=1128113 RepID=A0ABQ5UZC6_9PROT|nr:GGDEF-domain containing protein [Algimonas porphyrae]